MNEYSLEKIKPEHLDQLSELVRSHLDEKSSGKLSLICLCQGAALHFVNQSLKKGNREFNLDENQITEMIKKAKANGKKVGVNDFDVWGFFPTPPDRKRQCYNRRAKIMWFNSPPFDGKKIDIFYRSLPCQGKKDIESAVIKWLRESRNPTPIHLKQKPAVVIWPESKRGKVIWPK